jgi:hypothetical protein
MRKQLRCADVLTRSLPNVHQLLARLNALYDGCRPVTTQRLAEVFELFFITKDGGEFRPLPTTYANTWLNSVQQLWLIACQPAERVVNCGAV